MVVWPVELGAWPEHGPHKTKGVCVSVWPSSTALSVCVELPVWSETESHRTKTSDITCRQYYDKTDKERVEQKGNQMTCSYSWSVPQWILDLFLLEAAIFGLVLGLTAAQQSCLTTFTLACRVSNYTGSFCRAYY